MAEKLVYTTPQGPPPAAEVWVNGIETRRRPSWLLHIETEDSNGLVLHHYYRDAEAEPLVKQLNKANLSGAGGSLEKRAINQLVTDGKLAAGTVTGAPD